VVTEPNDEFDEILCPKADSMNMMICPCGCGNIVIVLLNDEDDIIATGQLSPFQMITYADKLKELARQSLRET
jgi:hypothetical protein